MHTGSSPTLTTTIPRPEFALPFFPAAPTSLREAGLSDRMAESLVLKYLLFSGPASGRDIAGQVALPFALVEPVLHALKAQRWLVFRSDAPLSDYIYELTEAGSGRARSESQETTYCGAAPVALDEYLIAVEAQSLTRKRPRMPDVRRAFADLVLPEATLCQLGEAISAGLGLFLFGEPGNGKTSIAQRVMRTYDDAIWIPRAINAHGQIIRLFDASHHQPVEQSGDAAEHEAAEPAVDKRWVRIRRPTIVVGGELTLDHLEITLNATTGVAEAPLHLKSNCGALVIDDFGRQRIEPVELLNRWIYPLENRSDHLTLASGRKIEVPFDQMLIFSTNLDLRSLADEALLRRIPYKIGVADPTPDEFRTVLHRKADELGLACPRAPVQYLLEEHFNRAGRSLRYCHARDLLGQVLHACRFQERAPAVTDSALDAAVKNYFAL